MRGRKIENFNRVVFLITTAISYNGLLNVDNSVTLKKIKNFEELKFIKIIMCIKMVKKKRFVLISLFWNIILLRCTMCVNLFQMLL